MNPGGNGAPRIVVPESIRKRIVETARAEAPREACGLLVGSSRRGAVVVVRADPARNLETRRPAERYTLAPEDHLAAERRARDEGLEIVGFWHSHGSAGAEPSAADRRTAWEGYSYLIVSLAGRAAPQLRSWRLIGDRFVEEELATAEANGEPGAGP